MIEVPVTPLLLFLIFIVLMTLQQDIKDWLNSKTQLNKECLTSLKSIKRDIEKITTQINKIQYKGKHNANDTTTTKEKT